jgi:hypothetical protein
MNVMTVGLLCIALYAIVAVAWIRYDTRQDTSAEVRSEGPRP